MHPRAEELIRTLQLAPHPEGGHFRRVYESAKRTEVNGIERPTLTAIKFLLPADVTTRCTGWMPPRSGTGTKAVRWSCRCSIPSSVR